MTTKIAIDHSHAYRMADACRDYADLLVSEGDAFGLADGYKITAERIESGERIGYGLIAVDRFDVRASESAVVALLSARREAAEDLRREADDLDAEAIRWERLLDTAF